MTTKSSMTLEKAPSENLAEYMPMDQAAFVGSLLTDEIVDAQFELGVDRAEHAIAYLKGVEADFSTTEYYVGASASPITQSIHSVMRAGFKWGVKRTHEVVFDQVEEKYILTQRASSLLVAHSVAGANKAIYRLNHDYPSHPEYPTKEHTALSIGNPDLVKYVSAETRAACNLEKSL